MTTETILSERSPRSAETRVKWDVLQSYSRLLRMVLEEVSDAVLVLDSDGEAIIANRAFDRLLGPRPAGIHDQRDLAELLRALGTTPDAATLAELLTVEEAPRVLLERDGGGGLLECHVKRLDLEAPGDHRLITFREVNSHGSELRELRHRAFHDRLTGLPNRELLLDRLHQAIARRGREGAAVGVVFIDLDGFKEINDELGHAAGDEVLVEVSARLSAGMRQVDTVGRLGGDEFVIVCESVSDAESIEVICRRVQEALVAPIVVDGRALTVTASMGAVVEWDHDAAPAELVARADKQMYAAKRDGTQLQVEAGNSTSIDERAARLARTLGRALRDGDLELVYLPLLALGHNRVTAVEALLRCPHPELHEHSPVDLVALADQGGFLSELSSWILSEGAAVAADMRGHRDDETHVVINLSEAQLADPALPDVVSRAVSTAGIDHRLLGFDIAEGAIAATGYGIQRGLRTLSELGCRLYADDVTGAVVAVESLCELGFDAIKLDRRVLEAAAVGNGSFATGTALVASAHEMHMSVVAEGVSDERTLLTARRLGCDGAQGYALFGAPRRAPEIRRLFD